jgi:hypothetical protein
MRRVHELVDAVSESGVYPSRRRINRLLIAEKLVLAEPEIAQAYAEAISSLRPLEGEHKAQSARHRPFRGWDDA